MNIKEKLINNYVTSFIWFGYKYLKYRIPMTIASIHKVDNKKVTFMSFNGKNYADNPRAISEKLHECNPEYTIVWGMEDIEKAKKNIPSYVTIVKFGSLAWYRELATSSVWVANVLLPNGILKRKNQRYIQTWHGDRGFKRILFDATDSMEKFRKRNYFRKIIEPELCDLGVVGSAYGEMQYRSAMHYDGPLLKNGTPRDDCLVNLTKDYVEKMKEKIGIPIYSNVLLYAPTFRDHLHGKVQEVGLDLMKILSILEQKTKEPWICIQRGHVDSSLEQTKNSENRIIDLTSYEDMADILCVSDLLITDYSSTPGDIALSGKATILFQEDYENYTSDDRKLYFEMENTPFWVAHNNEELIELISNYNEEDAKQNAKEILDFYKTYETGSSCEAVVHYIVDGLY